MVCLISLKYTSIQRIALHNFFASKPIPLLVIFLISNFEWKSPFSFRVQSKQNYIQIFQNISIAMWIAECCGNSKMRGESNATYFSQYIGFSGCAWIKVLIPEYFEWIFYFTKTPNGCIRRLHKLKNIKTRMKGFGDVIIFVLFRNPLRSSINQIIQSIIYIAHISGLGGYWERKCCQLIVQTYTIHHKIGVKNLKFLCIAKNLWTIFSMRRASASKPTTRAHMPIKIVIWKMLFYNNNVE